MYDSLASSKTAIFNQNELLNAIKEDKSLFEIFLDDLKNLDEANKFLILKQKPYGYQLAYLFLEQDKVEELINFLPYFKDLSFLIAQAIVDWLDASWRKASDLDKPKINLLEDKFSKTLDSFTGLNPELAKHFKITCIYSGGLDTLNHFYDLPKDVKTRSFGSAGAKEKQRMEAMSVQMQRLSSLIVDLAVINLKKGRLSLHNDELLFLISLNPEFFDAFYNAVKANSQAYHEKFDHNISDFLISKNKFTELDELSECFSYFGNEKTCKLLISQNHADFVLKHLKKFRFLSNESIETLINNNNDNLIFIAGLLLTFPKIVADHAFGESIIAQVKEQLKDPEVTDVQPTFSVEADPAKLTFEFQQKIAETLKAKDELERKNRALEDQIRELEFQIRDLKKTSLPSSASKETSEKNQEAFVRELTQLFNEQAIQFLYKLNGIAGVKDGLLKALRGHLVIFHTDRFPPDQQEIVQEKLSVLSQLQEKLFQMPDEKLLALLQANNILE